MPNLSLTQTLEDVTLVAIVGGNRQLALIQTLDPVVLSATVALGRAMAFTNRTAEAKLVSHVELGERPFPIQLLPRLYNLTGEVRQSSGAILCFVGPPHRSIEWRLLQGHGTLTPFTTFTDRLGQCACRYDAGGMVEKVIVGVAYVP